MAIKPYAGLSKKRLEKLINDINLTELVSGVDYTYGLPSAFTDNEGRNTKVTLTPVDRTRYARPQEVYYRRLDISVLDNLPPGYIRRVYVPSLPFSIHGNLPRINRYLGLDLTPDEVEDSTFFEPQETYRLKIVESRSLAWLGTYHFRPQFSWDGIPLEEVVTNPELTGFVYPIVSSQLGSDRENQLLGIVNEANIIAPPLSLADVIITGLESYQTENNSRLNAKVTLTAMNGGRYTDSIDVFYHRIDAAELQGNLDYLTEGPLLLSSLVAHINQQAGADLLVSEVAPLPALSLQVGDIVDVNVEVLPGSLRWTGSKTVQMLYGLPPGIEKLHVLMNHTLPMPGYIT